MAGAKKTMAKKKTAKKKTASSASKVTAKKKPAPEEEGSGPEEARAPCRSDACRACLDTLVDARAGTHSSRSELGPELEPHDNRTAAHHVIASSATISTGPGWAFRPPCFCWSTS